MRVIALWRSASIIKTNTRAPLADATLVLFKTLQFLHTDNTVNTDATVNTIAWLFFFFKKNRQGKKLLAINENALWEFIFLVSLYRRANNYSVVFKIPYEDRLIKEHYNLIFTNNNLNSIDIQLLRENIIHLSNTWKL